jgi:hypothetical protein
MNEFALLWELHELLYSLVQCLCSNCLLLLVPCFAMIKTNEMLPERACHKWKHQQ